MAKFLWRYRKTVEYGVREKVGDINWNNICVVAESGKQAIKYFDLSSIDPKLLFELEFKYYGGNEPVGKKIRVSLW